MFDIGMWEMLVVGIVALIVVGPQDLPKMFRTLGQITGRIRGMAREFQTTMNAAASETGLDEISKDIRKATDIGKELRSVTNPVRYGADKLKDAAFSDLDEIDEEIKSAARPLQPGSVGAPAPAAAPAAEASPAEAAPAQAPAEPRTGTTDP